jgi:hypothetical protein
LLFIDASVFQNGWLAASFPKVPVGNEGGRAALLRRKTSFPGQARTPKNREKFATG